MGELLKLKMGKENEAFDDVEMSGIPKAGQEFENGGHPPAYETPSYENAYVPAGDINIESSGFDEINRRPFLMKVCITVCLQMCLLGGFTCWILLDYDTACFVASNYWFYWVVILAFPIVAAVIGCSDKLMRTSPLNLISLAIFSVLMAFMFAFLAGLWSTAGTNCGSTTFCYAADDIGCNGNYTWSKVDYCARAEECIQEAFSVIVPAGVGTASIFFLSLILTLCGFDIFNHMKIVILLYFVLSWPIGLLGWFLFPIDVYWAMICVFVIFCGSVGILFTLSLIVNNKYDFSPDEWIRASMYIFMQIGRIFV